jgi:limonene-1,2-epoxide hydrolase
MEPTAQATNTNAVNATANLAPQTVVELFLEACSEFDFEGALELIADDCVYQNVPFHRATGKARIKRDLKTMAKALNLFKVDMIHIAVNGDAVLTERVDTLGGRLFRLEIPLMGVFVVKHGKISEWRDYFDWSAMMGRFGFGLLKGKKS